ncbi:MAG TPA: glycoside hydrolase family 2 [Porphyromonadaceae bacterium]|nr:glycoside hydrolase family 2 [Porphyromonadaceae bacterium]
MNLKYFFCVLFLSTFIGDRIYAQVSFGIPQMINEDWLFQLGDDPKALAMDYDDSKWRKVDLPHDWSVEAPLSPHLASCTGYLPGGIGWYRKALFIPDLDKERKVFIYFEGIYNKSEVYINGQLLGKRPNGYISFMYDLTPYIQFGKENILSVRVDHSEYADSRWYTGSGIYRNVWLVYSDKVHIDQWGVFWQAKNITRKDAVLDVQVNVKNESSQKQDLTVFVELFSAEGKMVAEKSKKILMRGSSLLSSTELSLKIKKPVLWGMENPYLYRLRTSIISGNKVLDESELTVGIRSLKFDPDKGFALNGEWMKIKGVCIHHDAGCLGSAVPRKVWKRRLQNLKKIGCNAIRMSHNPQAPDVYDLCDELGLLVMDEAFDEWKYPKKKSITGWNTGVPGYQGSFSFFEEWSDRDIRDMVLRNRNHPSIIMWSIGNEIDFPNDPYSHPVLETATFNQPSVIGYLPDHPSAEELGKIAKRLAGNVRSLDTSRPVTAALAGAVMSNETEYPFVLDIVGYNYSEFQYKEDHLQYPERVMFGSETNNSFAGWKATRDNDFIFGQFLWTGIDYVGESREWPSRGYKHGLLDLAGFQKPEGFFRQAMWDTKPFIYIGTYNPNRDPNRSVNALPIWNYSKGENIRVVCYTNCQQAQLVLNGQTISTVKEYDDNVGFIAWDIPFQIGKLEVVGLNGKKEAVRYAIVTSGRPYKIIAEIDNLTLHKNKDLAHIAIQIVDEMGLPVLLSDDEITCQIEGPAKLLGLESGNNADMGNYRDNVQRVHNGRLMAYIETTGSEGNVKVTFSSPWLKTAEVYLIVK